MSNFEFEYGPAFVNITPEESLDTCGVAFDRITAASEPLSDPLDRHDISTWFEICAGLEGPYGPTQQDLSEVFWRTLTADTYDKSPAPDSMHKAFKYWICSHLAMAIAQKVILALPKNKHVPHLRSAPLFRRWKG